MTWGAQSMNKSGFCPPKQVWYQFVDPEEMESLAGKYEPWALNRVHATVTLLPIAFYAPIGKIRLEKLWKTNNCYTQSAFQCHRFFRSSLRHSVILPSPEWLRNEKFFVEPSAMVQNFLIFVSTNSPFSSLGGSSKCFRVSEIHWRESSRPPLYQSVIWASLLQSSSNERRVVCPHGRTRGGSRVREHLDSMRKQRLRLVTTKGKFTPEATLM